MDKKYIAEHQLVDRYVQGRLSGDELSNFEVYLLDHPELLDDIEYADGMHSAFASAAELITPKSKKNLKPRQNRMPPVRLALTFDLNVLSTPHHVRGFHISRHIY